MNSALMENLRRHQFLFEELVRRDFVKKYKRTVLGMLWSVLSPLFNLLVLWLVFSNLLGSNVNHYVIFLFSGQLVFSYFSEATNMGMLALMGNAGIFTKVNVPKCLFLFSQNVTSLINFGLTLVIYFIFVLLDGLSVTPKFLCLLYPIACLVLFNLGVGMILSALLVFFRDMQYLWGIMTHLIMWGSAIFFSIDSFSPAAQMVFNLNPIYLYISYFREIVINGSIPSFSVHALMLFDALAVGLAGTWMYRRFNNEFLYYV